MIADLNIAEIMYESGEVQLRYARYLSDNSARWVRHGLYCHFYKNGNVASEGTYEHGFEQGLWRDYHENGQLAAEGRYQNGEKVGEWHYWDDHGKLE